MNQQPPPRGFRTFVVLWATQSVSVFGSALTFFAISIWLTQTLYPAPDQKPLLAAALSVISLARMLPALLAAPVAGAWADRHDRRHTMLWCDLGSGLVSVTLVALMATQSLTLPVLAVLLAISALLDAFHGSSFDTSYAMLVPRELLPRANGMMQTIWSLVGVLSPGLAALIVSIPALARQGHVPGALGHALGGLQNGSALAIGIDAVTFFFSAVMLLFLAIPSPVRTDLGPGKQRSLLADAKFGAEYIWRRRPLLWLLGSFAMANLLFSPMGLFVPLIVKFNLAADWAARGFTFETALALLGTVMSMGGVVAGVAVSFWGGLKQRRVYGVLVPILLAGACQLVYGMSSYLYLAAAMAFVIGAHMPVANAHSQSIWQSQVPPELQGRVFAIRRVIAQCTNPLMTAVAGFLGGRFNSGTVLAVMGGVLVLFMAVQLLNPIMLRVEDREYLEQLAAGAE